MKKFVRKRELSGSSSEDPDDPGIPTDFKRPYLGSTISSGRRESQASTTSSVSASEEDIERDAASLCKALESTDSSEDNEEEGQRPAFSSHRPAFSAHRQVLTNLRPTFPGSEQQIPPPPPAGQYSDCRDDRQQSPPFAMDLSTHNSHAMSAPPPLISSFSGGGRAASAALPSGGDDGGGGVRNGGGGAGRQGEKGGGRSRPDQPGSYSTAAEKMMQAMGYKSGSGLGKAGQGRLEPVGLSTQRGRRGLGLIIKGLETDTTLEWDGEDEKIVIEEEVKWMPTHSLPVPPLHKLRSWIVDGKRKLDISDETLFCDPEVLKNVLSCKTVFDKLESDELMKARTRSNPFETIRSGFFLNRAAMKMANMDAVFNNMFSHPVDENGHSLVSDEEPLYFADVCAGPGGFSEYVLWQNKWRCKGFGFTIKSAGHEFRLEDFYAGPPEGFEPYYGVDGVDGDGDIFKTDNILQLKRFVLENTDGIGVHFMMADGGFSVEGDENIQEILSKQLYLCQFLVALAIVRTKGHFVCKLFDTFTPFSAGLIYLMYRGFEHVAIHKPNTSRPANSERYIICKWKRPDCGDIHDYLFELQERLSRLNFDLCGRTRSETDILEIVPHHIMAEDEGFVRYLTESNNQIGDAQVVGLSKIAAFCKNPNLYENRQAEVRRMSLEFWKVPDEARLKPVPESPVDAISRLFSGSPATMEVIRGRETCLENPSNLEAHFKSIYDWRFIVTATPRHKLQTDRTFILSTGRSKVFMLDNQSMTWTKIQDRMKMELPADTLLYGEVVTELKGEGKSQRRTYALHVIDALFLGGDDVRKLHFMERNKKTKLFVKVMNKPSRSDLMRLRMKTVCKLEDLKNVWSHLDMKLLKGASGNRRLVFTMDDPETDGLPRCYQPQGLLFYRTVKFPYTMALSKSKGQKYWFNVKTGTSDFLIPPESIAEFETCHSGRVAWFWDTAGDINPAMPAQGKGVSRKAFESFLQHLR